MLAGLSMCITHDLYGRNREDTVHCWLEGCADRCCCSGSASFWLFLAQRDLTSGKAVTVGVVTRFPRKQGNARFPRKQGQAQSFSFSGLPCFAVDKVTQRNTTHLRSPIVKSSSACFTAARQRFY